VVLDFFGGGKARPPAGRLTSHARANKTEETVRVFGIMGVFHFLWSIFNQG
jgi:hypothetical protein